MTARSRIPSDQVPTQIREAPAAPTLVDPSSAPRPAPAPSASSSQPLRVISMKTPPEPARLPELPLPKQHRLQMRDMAQVRQRHATPPHGLGNLAPPRDERDARVRRRQEYLLWGAVIVILGTLVALGIWFLAR